MRRLATLIKEELRTITLRELSRRTNVPAIGIYNYSFPSVEPSEKHLERLAAYFGKPFSYFYEESAEDNKPDAPDESRLLALHRKLSDKYAGLPDEAVMLKRYRKLYYENSSLAAAMLDLLSEQAGEE
jgi:transcriptional regulator with XRE-family HTH domain